MGRQSPGRDPAARSYTCGHADHLNILARLTKAATIAAARAASGSAARRPRSTDHDGFGDQRLSRRQRQRRELARAAARRYDGVAFIGPHRGGAPWPKYERALAVIREVGDRREEAATWHALGELDQLAGDFPAARAKYERSLAVFRELGNRHLEAQTQGALDGLDSK